MSENESYPLYTGCLIRSRLPHLEKSARMVFDRLGVKLSELTGATCCPEGVGFRGLDEEVWLTLAARNLSLADQSSRPMLTLCSGCYSTFRECEHILAENKSLREKVARNLENINRQYSPGPGVEHFARFLYEKVGAPALTELVSRPLRGLKTAFHQGCHFLRPSHLIDFDDPDHPTKLEELIRALGAETIDYPRKMLCCGLTIAGVDPDLSLRMGFEKMKLMKDCGAQAVVLICPACMLQFDLNQRRMEQVFGRELSLPVFYLTELIGLAMGESADSLGLALHRTDVRPLLDSLWNTESAAEPPGGK